MVLEFKLNLDMKYVTNEKKVQFHAFHPAVTCTTFQCLVSQILQLSLSLENFIYLSRKNEYILANSFLIGVVVRK